MEQELKDLLKRHENSNLGSEAAREKIVKDILELIKRRSGGSTNNN